MKKFIIVGMPGCGKSTMAKYLCSQTSLTFYDLDREIENKERKKIKEIFSDKGENYFRKVESIVLKKIIKEKENFILATGGGTPCFNDNMKIINKYGISIFLNTSIDILEERISRNKKRPLFNNSINLKKDLINLLGKRHSFFCSSNYIIENNNREKTLSIINSYS
ncbi:MAG: shikimate kinase [Bacteroidota bacterium]|jgi:shikimate kinase|nr:shikimate kinase [Bacteroidota bacterium]